MYLQTFFNFEQQHQRAPRTTAHATDTAKDTHHFKAHVVAIVIICSGKRNFHKEMRSFSSLNARVRSETSIAWTPKNLVSL